MRFKEYGLESFEVVDNGSGIPPEDYDSIGECVILTSHRCRARRNALLAAASILPHARQAYPRLLRAKRR